MTDDFARRLYCVNCRKFMGLIDDDELLAYWDDKDDPGLCFDCDPDSASTVPALFWQWNLGDVFVLGDTSLKVRWDKYPEKPLVCITHTHDACAGARGLSSSTYLNNSEIDRSQRGKEILSKRMCRDCGSSGLQCWSDGWHCPDCASFEPYPSTIHYSADVVIIPDWIIGPQIQDGEYCEDCRRVNGRVVWYCPYHLDLLGLERGEYGGRIEID